MDALIDTNIVIDFYRGLASAGMWMQANSKLRIGISPYVWMEAIAGTQSKTTQAQMMQILKRFTILEFSQAELEWAKLKLLQFRPSHKVEFADCLIAASSSRLQIPLYTRNLKHMVPLLGTLAIEPYKDNP